MTATSLGRVYRDGEIVVRQGEAGEHMYVVQEGTVDVLLEKDGSEVRLRTLGKGEIVGEMGLFERDIRSATVRARGEARLLTVDRKTFLRRISEDPSLAFHLVETMSRRIRDLSEEVARLRLEHGQEHFHDDSPL